jgi:hypothetical protein
LGIEFVVGVGADTRLATGAALFGFVDFGDLTMARGAGRRVPRDRFLGVIAGRRYQSVICISLHVCAAAGVVAVALQFAQGDGRTR